MRRSRREGTNGWWVALVILVATLTGTGCQYGAYFFRPRRVPMQALHVQMDPSATRSCVVVMMPGMLNTPDTWIDLGFVEDAVLASRRCDILSVDAHYGYYRHRTVTRRVGEDILRAARRRGYQTIWLVGGSMGGMGAMRVARAYPELVDGVVLLGPWFGDLRVPRAIRSAGGLLRWRPSTPLADPADPESLWAWMRGYATRPEDMPPLYVAVGESDGMRVGTDVLAEHLPPQRYGLAPGGHDWGVLRGLWRQLLRHPPWDPVDAEPGFGER